MAAELDFANIRENRSANRDTTHGAKSKMGKFTAHNLRGACEEKKMSRQKDDVESRKLNRSHWKHVVFGGGGWWWGGIGGGGVAGNNLANTGNMQKVNKIIETDLR